MANVTTTDVDNLMTLIKNDTVLAQGQKGQASGILFQLLKAIFGPTASTTIIGNGSV